MITVLLNGTPPHIITAIHSLSSTLEAQMANPIPWVGHALPISEQAKKSLEMGRGQESTVVIYTDVILFQRAIGRCWTKVALRETLDGANLEYGADVKLGEWQTSRGEARSSAASSAAISYQ